MPALTGSPVPPRLHPDLLPRLPLAVARPAYDRRALRPGIVHLGIGAFMRAHLAVATEAAIHSSGDLRWGIVGVSLRRPDTRDALAPQQGLYTVAERDGKRERLRVIGCVRELLVAPENPQAVLEAIAHPQAHVLSLTVTEKGYAPDGGDAGVPRGVAGFLVHGLALRRGRGLAPPTLVSLDNLPSNGATLRRLVLDAARPRDPALADWIEAGCAFPNSMVDRIVPRTTEADRAAVQAALGQHDAWPVVAEPFFDWAVEDRFAGPRPAWEAGGARLVPGAAAWEQLKLRMVNGAHSSLAYLGQLAGWATVDEAVAQPALARHLQALWRDEVAPTLAPLPGLDLAGYRTALLARFANPALAHRTAQIAIDGSQKLPQRLLAPVRERLAAGAPIPRLALGIAAWLTFLRGRDERGARCAIDDPLADALAAHVARAEAIADGRARAAALTRFAPVFGDLADVPALVDALVPPLESLRTRGVRATLEVLE
jgi:fructuronate reductase